MTVNRSRLLIWGHRMGSDRGVEAHWSRRIRRRPGPGEALWLRQPADMVGEADGRALLQGGVVVLVTDRKLIAARTSGGFRPRWEVFTLPFGHLEPGVLAGGEHGSDVAIPTSGRRSYRVQLADSESAARLAGSLGEALGAYRRDRMGVQDP